MTTINLNTEFRNYLNSYYEKHQNDSEFSKIEFYNIEDVNDISSLTTKELPITTFPSGSLETLLNNSNNIALKNSIFSDVYRSLFKTLNNHITSKNVEIILYDLDFIYDERDLLLNKNHVGICIKVTFLEYPRIEPNIDYKPFQ